MYSVTFLTHCKGAVFSKKTQKLVKSYFCLFGDFLGMLAGFSLTFQPSQPIRSSIN